MKLIRVCITIVGLDYAELHYNVGFDQSCVLKNMLVVVTVRWISIRISYELKEQVV